MASITENVLNDSYVLRESARGSDYFSGLLNDNWWKTVGLTISCFGIIASPLILFSIIWFEKYGNDNKRTLLNMFVSLYCWAVIEFVLFVQVPETARFLIGPLPPFVCRLHAFLRGSIVNVLLLYKNASVTTRYIFIFWLKNPAAFNDEFWCRMLLIWVHICSFLIRGIDDCISTKFSIHYYVCICKEPHLTGQPKFNGIMELFTIALHIFVYTRIYFYKRNGKEGKHVAAKKNLTLKDVETR